MTEGLDSTFRGLFPITPVFKYLRKLHLLFVVNTFREDFKGFLRVSYGERTLVLELPILQQRTAKHATSCLAIISHRHFRPEKRAVTGQSPLQTRQDKDTEATLSIHTEP
jgi:hypothetical protein